MKILITAPSLDENENVSGISSVARQIIEHGKWEFTHFQAGRRDDEKSKMGWIYNQLFLVPKFLRVIRREKVDLAHINTALNPLSILRDYALARAAKSMKIPILLHVHGGRFLAREFENRALAKLAENMLRLASVVVVLSELEKKIVERRWKNISVKVLENAVPVGDAPDFERGARREKAIIFLGRLHESKGLNEIVEACRILKNEGFDFRFKCFGAGASRDFFIEEMTKILGEKFYYGGVISGAKKQRELTESDVFLLPSRYGEGLPMAMLEAMAAGCLPVVSEMASVGAVVRDGENGFLIEPQNTAQLVEKLKLLLSDKADWETLRQAARKTVEEKFNLKDYIKKLESIYSEVAGNTK